MKTCLIHAYAHITCIIHAPNLCRPRPSTVSEVRRFLGLCSYYRRFVPNFADLAHPLHQCTEHTQIFNWNDELENSFVSLKKALTEAPVLGYPDRKAHFVLDTDASAHGIGAVLSQIHNEEEWVVAYYSSTFSRPERKYCVTRKELLAVVKSVQHFYHYLYGRRFTVRTDHAALKWLLNFRNPEGQIAWWIERLQHYDLPDRAQTGSQTRKCRCTLETSLPGRQLQALQQPGSKGATWW